MKKFGGMADEAKRMAKISYCGSYNFCNTQPYLSSMHINRIW